MKVEKSWSIDTVQLYVVTLLCSFCFLAYWYCAATKHTFYSNWWMNIASLIAGLYGLYLGKEVVPHIKDLKRTVTGREDYIKKAIDIYRHSSNVCAVIGKWDTTPKYTSIFRSAQGGDIRIIGCIDEVTFLGALARIADIKANPNGKRISIRHIDQSKLHFKFVVGDDAVLIGEEMDKADPHLGSEQGHLFLSEFPGTDGYPAPFIQLFDTLWNSPASIDAELEITRLAVEALVKNDVELGSLDVSNLRLAVEKWLRKRWITFDGTEPAKLMETLLILIQQHHLMLIQNNRPIESA